MASHLHADHAAPPPDPGSVDALISQARRLRGQVDAVRRDALAVDDAAQARWQRALCELAMRQLDDLGEHLGQLREELDEDRDAEDTDEAAGRGGVPDPEGVAYPALLGAEDASVVVRAGSAEWNLLTDQVEWSEDLYRIFGRTHADGPLTLDELPSWLFADDQRTLTEMVTGCLVDGRPINGEFRIVRPDGSVRTVHMTGEPVLDADGGTASMWAVLRDVSDLRRTQHTLRETRDSLDHQRWVARTEHRLAVEVKEAALPPWRGPLRFPPGGEPVALDLAAGFLPAGADSAIGGGWHDAMRLPDDATLLTVGELTGRGDTATAGTAMLLGAVRGMALAGIEPAALTARLNELLSQAVLPALGSALCCRYEPSGRTLTWSQAGHPPPVLYRDGVGRVLGRPEGMLLGAAPAAEYGQHTERLRAGDLLVLHTDGLVPRLGRPDTADDASRFAQLLALGPRFADVRHARTCVRVIAEELGLPEREDDACVLVARVT